MVWKPSTSMFQIPIMPRTMGPFCPAAVVRKCSSTVCKPARKSAKCSRPMEIISDSPIAESTE